MSKDENYNKVNLSDSFMKNSNVLNNSHNFLKSQPKSKNNSYSSRINNLEINEFINKIDKAH